MTGTPQGLGRRAARGATVTAASQGARILLQVAAVAVLARLVPPAEYGLVAMVAAAVGVGEILRDAGLSSAAMRAPDLTRQQRDNLFWVNLAIGAALCVACIAAAPLIARLFDEPALIGICRALAFVFLINGLATQHKAGLVREMRFRTLAVVEVAAPVAALGTAIAVGLVTHDHRAVVVQQVATAAVTLAGVWVAGRWLPARPRRGAGTRGFFRFGGGLLGSQLVGYGADNLATFVIGLSLGPGPLGLYNRAYQLLMRPLTQLRQPSTTVALPVLARIAEDPVRFDRMLLRGQQVLALPIVLVLAVVVGASDAVVGVFLGPGWESAAPLLAAFAVAGGCQTLAYVGYWTYLARGLSGALLAYSMVTAVLKIAGVLVGSFWGVNGIAAGFAASAILEWPLSFWWLSRITSYPGGRLALGGLRVLAQAVPVGLAAWGAGLLPGAAGASATGLAIAVASGLLVWGLCLAAVPALRRDAALLVQLLRAVRGRAG
ncbi:lipopolysaccharide biosynthesis protein [Myceligenerans pegani]|uniref:Lipopolysaccharide biosynthesis protein n=1 Tax=Myceligenerans pegani TaxID=2776917 RepID=A0ABR9MTU2_9MICO|nr:lipopolysaccharide biosynthesis protein [Myceligenerans sp. TRM 65318]MBE1874786.1 lipopolysaccharide biosynthesis protein [Myceligenerans sp. TRM 65318]MBE3017057.1 lipopolysaccharide biosynthesis protein [Myceligenerans sp. TRM 65318]